MENWATILLIGIGFSPAQAEDVIAGYGADTVIGASHQTLDYLKAEYGVAR